MCAPLPSSPEPASVDPDAVGDLVEALRGRAPFGEMLQVAEALDDATTGAAGGAIDWCFDLPRWTSEGTGTTEACIPATDFTEPLAVWRGLLLVLLTIGFGVALVKTVTKLANA